MTEEQNVEQSMPWKKELERMKEEGRKIHEKFLALNPDFKPISSREELVELINETFEIMIKAEAAEEEKDRISSIRNYLWGRRKFYKLLEVDFENEIKPQVSKEAYDLFLAMYGAFLELPESEAKPA
jgi:hypothetical protein